MFLKKLVIKNLLGTESREIEFGNETHFTGSNGSGKSTIKEAILFALYGMVNGTNKIDTAIRNGADNIYVYIEGSFKGNDFIIERVRDRTSSIIKYNGKEVKQETLDVVFGEYKLFISAVCVGDFMKLDDNNKIDIINNIFPSNKEKIYKKIVGEDIAKKFPFTITLEKDIEKSYKETSAKIDNIRHEKVLISSKIEELSKQEAPVCTTDESILNSIRQRIIDFESKKPVMTYTKPDNLEIKEYKSQLEVLEKEYSAFVLQVPDMTLVNKLVNDINNVTNEINNLKSNNTCLACGRPFDDISIQLGKLNHKLEKIKVDGKMESERYKTSLEGYNIKKNKYSEDIKKIKDKIFLLEVEEDKVNAKNIEIFNEDLTNYENKLSELKEEYNIKADELKNYLIKKDYFDSVSDTIHEHKRKLQDYDKELALLDLLVIEKVKEAFGTKGIEYQEIQSKTELLKGLFPENTIIELMKKNKTNDGFTKCFNVIVDDVPYNWLSKGMKKLVDIKLCQIISSKMDYGFVIIDDLESVTSDPIIGKDIQVVKMTAKPLDFTFFTK